MKTSIGEKVRATLAVAVWALALSEFDAMAIPELRISVQNDDVVLTWPSESGATYIVQYRPTLLPETPWVMLSTNHPAGSGEITTFIHEDMFICPPAAGGGGGGSGPPPLPGGPGLASSSSGESSSLPFWERWKTEGRQPYAFEREQRPPYPWEAGDWSAAYGLGTPESLTFSTSLSGGESLMENPGCVGFYRAVADGVRFWSLTNGIVLRGVTNILIEAANHIGTLQSVTLTANSASIAGTEMLATPFSSPLTFAFDTRMLANGTYSLAASANWVIVRSNTVESPFVDRVSAPVSVTIENDIFYPDWVQEFGEDFLIVNVSLSVQSADWFVDLWDSEANYLGFFDGHTDNGLINFSWDMRDNTGTRIESPVFHTATEMIPTGLPPGEPAPLAATQINPLLLSVTDDYPTEGWWAGALMDFLPHHVNGYDEFKERIDAMASIAEMNFGLLPNDNRVPGQLHVIRVGPAHGNNDWTPFWMAMQNRDVRNVYYWGHGSPSALGDSDGGFSLLFLQNVLGNNFTSTTKHRFRFVWLDGCDTARGDWPHAFALGKRENVPISQYSSRPGVFCGFMDKVTVATLVIDPATGAVITGSIPDRVGFFRSNFAFYWGLASRTVVDAFHDSRIASGAFDDWIKLKLYGFQDMYYEQFNRRSDWPVPQ